MSTATFVSSDILTQGDWIGEYGADGYDIFFESSYPAGVGESHSGLDVWSGFTPVNPKSLQKFSSPAERTGVVLYSNNGTNPMFINLNFPDGAEHLLALYFFDYDNVRTQEVAIRDRHNGDVDLDRRQISDLFDNPQYLVYKVSGHIRIEVGPAVGDNAYISGILFDTVAPLPEIGPDDLTSNLSHPPFVASSDAEGEGATSPYKAFDNDPATSWLGSVDTWLELDTGAGNTHELLSYVVAVPNTDEANRAPKDWTMAGSNDGSSWTVLDTQAEQIDWGNGEARRYDCEVSEGEYRYFRLNILANNGHIFGYSQVARLSLYGITSEEEPPEEPPEEEPSQEEEIEMPVVDRMSAMRHVLANNGEAVISVAHLDYPKKTVVSTIADAAAVTFTAEQLLGGLILRDPNGAGRADIVPTGALMVAAMPGAFAGQSIEFTIRNTADAAETITVTTAASGSTLSGVMTIAQNNSKRFLLVVTAIGAAPTYTLYSLGTVTT